MCVAVEGLLVAGVVRAVSDGATPVAGAARAVSDDALPVAGSSSFASNPIKKTGS